MSMMGQCNMLPLQGSYLHTQKQTRRTSRAIRAEKKRMCCRKQTRKSMYNEDWIM